MQVSRRSGIYEISGCANWDVSGSGSILEALRYQKRIIVVPNETLMDNHQVELAEEMHRQKYVIHSSIP